MSEGRRSKGGAVSAAGPGSPPGGPSRRTFFVSDRTGITAETLGHSLLSQFEGVTFVESTHPFVDTPAKARTVVGEINAAAQATGTPPLVFSTLVTDELRDIVATCRGIFFDFFGEFIGPLEAELGAESSHAIGRTHGLVDRNRYNMRMDAVHFAMANDDGLNVQNYRHADVILIGVSRSGKTPTCVYLALHYGVFAANYPLTGEDLEGGGLPATLRPHKERLYGLTIDPKRLHAIRNRRRPGSRYATLAQCQKEVRRAEALFRAEGIACVSTTAMSIEEIAATLVHEKSIARHT